jgi:hypothetical protein
LVEALDPGRHHLLFLQQGITLFGQSIELFALLSDTVGNTFFGLATGLARGLFKVA